MSIQFSLFCIAHYHKLQMCLLGLYNLYTYNIPVPEPHIGSEKTPPKKRADEWAEHRQGHGIRPSQVQWTLRDVKSQRLRKGSRVNNVWWRDENSSTRREKRGDRCSVYPKRPPAAYQPIAAYQGAGPGEPDSALTISSVKEECLKSTLKWGDCVCLPDWRWKLVP